MNEIKQFLNLLDGRYYVLGGMALSKILRNVESHDWDLIIDSKYENIKSVKRKLRSVYKDADCVPVSFTRSYVGYHTVIHQCTITRGGEELFDIKFEDICNEPIVVLNGIQYLDIEGLYFNLVESINDNYELLYDFSLTNRKIHSSFIKDKIRGEVSELRSWIDESDDQEEIDDYNQEIDNLNSERHFNELRNEIIKNVSGLKKERKQAEKLIMKNSIRVRQLKLAIMDPTEFTPKYLNTLIKQCTTTDNKLRKKIGSMEFRCESLP